MPELDATAPTVLAEFPLMNPGPVFRIDPTGKVLLANPAAEALFGGRDITGDSFFELYPGMTQELWQRVLDSESPIEHETEIGDRFLAFTLAYGPVARSVFAYGADVSRLKHVERELSRLARFPEMNPGPVARMDRDGTILLANPAALQLFGGKDVIGKCWLDVCPQMNAAIWETVLRAAEPVGHEVRIGDRHFLFAHTPNPEADQVFVYGSELTDLKAAERAVRQTEKMATLGTLAAGVAHELNNPAAAAQRAAQQLGRALETVHSLQFRLGSMDFTDEEWEALIGLERDLRARAATPVELDPLERSDREAELEEWLEDRGVPDAWDLAPALVGHGYATDEVEDLLGRFGPERGPHVVTWVASSLPVYGLVEEIAHGAGRVSEIVTALKAYSYLGQAPIQSVDVNEGLHNTLVILRNKLKAGVTVERQLDPTLPRIQGYGSELNQVWTNLIDNAVDAMRGKGRLVVGTSADGDSVVVEIEDDGPGIPEDVQPRIFDPFFTTKAPGHGTGLGLNTSYNIVVKKHGGTIDVESRPGSTRFVVRLPIVAEDTPRSGHAAPANPPPPHSPHPS